MRTAQKAYFAARKKGDVGANAFLTQSKTYENNVDVMIKRVNEVLAEREKERVQPKLNF